ncbi:restriction endonuclease subunit S [uncultured Akkermansia sp.]|uniref:restriction endonuclease subunit S n=1 Tax=uncultured Akkermansia sp. TaxID=512294 RepID=UPI0026076707|nr:restriction endonuclease subunit S [uncultured Akkermansia sp.]
MRDMRESGVEWIGSVPATWQTLTIGSLFKVRNEKVNDTDYPPLSVSKGGIVPQMENVAKSDANDNRKMVLVDDFVINSRSDRKQSCGVSPLDGSVSLINTVLYTAKGAPVVPAYLNYLMKNHGFAEEFYRWGHGIVADLWTTRWLEMKSILLPIPTVEEQQQILAAISVESEKVDALIANIWAQIEKLKAYKQSVITEVVTKGLDPSVPMKDSGVEWIGEIPKHWSMTRIKFICDTFGRIGFRGYTTDDFVPEGEGAITLSPSNFSDMKMNYSKCSYLSWDKYNESPEIQIKNGDVLFVKTGSTYGKSCLVYNLPCEATINPQSIVFKKFKCDARLFCYFLNSVYAYWQVEQTVVGGTIPTIAQSKIINYIIVLPDEQSQAEIVAYLDEKCSQIDRLIAIKQKKINKLTEYKKSLIYEYVTGKKEVP